MRVRLVGLAALGIAACVGSGPGRPGVTSSSGGDSTSGGTGSASTSTGGSGAASTSTGGTGTTGSGLCCAEPPPSTGTTGGVSRLTGVGAYGRELFRLQDFVQADCTAPLADAGCQALTVHIRNHAYLGGPCAMYYGLILEGAVSDGGIVGRELPIDPAGGPDTAQVTLYTVPVGASGSTGWPDRRAGGALTFTLYEPATAGAPARVAGHFSADPDGGSPVAGTFDSASPDCACPACP